MGVPVDPEIQPADTNPKETDKCKTCKQGCLLWYKLQTFQISSYLHMARTQ